MSTAGTDAGAAPGPAVPLVLLEREEPIAIVRLNRPEVLNALSLELLNAVADAVEALDADPAIRCIILTGGEKAFSAGADISQFLSASPIDVALGERMARWDRFRRVNTPIIAAVDGFAMGGGCELVMACDIAIASDRAVFGLPETTIGVIPGAGGTQRAIGIIGKSLAMEMILAGRRLSAQEAAAHGLVSRVVAPDALLDEARRIAGEIAKRSSVAIRLARDAVNMALETGLTAGIEIERRAIGLAFASEDAREGFTAFVEKRPPEFKGR